MQSGKTLLAAAVMTVSSSASAQGVVSDNDCTISLSPTTVLIPQYGDDPVPGSTAGIFIMTASFATQGCSCVEPGDAGFDNPDGVILVTPGGDEIQPFRFNDIDGYAQFEYSVTQTVLDAGGGVFKVKIFDSCESEDRLVDEADFDVDLDLVNVPKPVVLPPQQVVQACVNNVNGLLRIVGSGVACRTGEYRMELPLPSSQTP
jgi:hypothetical protein